jgi:hypothetical protein
MVLMQQFPTLVIFGKLKPWFSSLWGVNVWWPSMSSKNWECVHVSCFLGAAGYKDRSYLHPLLSGYSSSWVFYSHTPIIPLISLLNSRVPLWCVVQTAVCLMDASKDQKKKTDVLKAMYYTVSAWQQVTQQTLEYHFWKTDCGRGHPSDISDVAMRNEDYDDAFHDWQKFSGTDNEKFDDYVSVNSHLVTCSVNTVKELCESH